MQNIEWQDIQAPGSPGRPITTAQITNGPVIPPQQQLLLYSEDQWEDFVQEWAHYYLKNKYSSVKRLTGSGDRGIDIAGFSDDNKLQGVWDNYQCKHYDHALYPSDIWLELGKIIWYSFKGEYRVPHRYYFVAPKGAGTSLTALFGNAAKLRAELIANWDKKVKDSITTTQAILLDTALHAYVDNFDFTIFEAKTALQLVEDHRATPCHAARFGGGLPPRPAASTPPVVVAAVESRYVTHLLDAYAQHTGSPAFTLSTLSTSTKLRDHFQRQREAFYEAESLRVFARDTVPSGTFESLQEDIYHGVVDTHDAAQPDGYVRVCAVTKAARELQITANALISCTKPKDRDGICHQLANEDRLQWKQ